MTAGAQRPLRLCFVADFNSIHVRKWVRFLCGRGHEVFVISTGYWDGEGSCGLGVFNISKKRGRRLRSLLGRLGLLESTKRVRSALNAALPDSYVWKEAQRQIEAGERAEVEGYLSLIREKGAEVRAIVRDLRPDLLQSLRLYPEGLLAFQAGFRPWIAMAWGQCISLWADRYEEVGGLVRTALGACDCYMVDNRRDLDDARRYGLPTDTPWHITPSGGGVDTQAVPRRRSGRNGANLADTVFMTFRRTGGWFINNLPVVEALSILRRQYGLNARFVVLGDGSGPFYEQLRIHAKRCGVEPYVDVRRPFPYERLAEVIAEYDVIVSSATHDGTSNALLETMWVGGIPVSSDLRPIREWITDGVNGYLFDLAAPHDIARTLVRAVEDGHRYEEIRALNEKIIRDRADYLSCMSRVEEIYERVVRSGWTGADRLRPAPVEE